MERKHARLFFLSEIFCVRLYMVLALSFDFRSGILVWQDCWLTFDGFELPWMHNSFLAASFEFRIAIKIKDVPASTGPMYALLSRYPCIHTLLLNIWFWRKFRCRKFHCDRIQSMYIVHSASFESFLFILLHHKSQHEFRMHCSYRMHWCAFLVIISLQWLCFNSDFISFSNHLPIFIFIMQLCIAVLPLTFFIATHTHFTDNLVLHFESMSSNQCLLSIHCIFGIWIDCTQPRTQFLTIMNILLSQLNFVQLHFQWKFSTGMNLPTPRFTPAIRKSSKCLMPFPITYAFQIWNSCYFSNYFVTSIPNGTSISLI